MTARPTQRPPRRRGGASVALLISVLILATVVLTALVSTSSSAAVSRGHLARVQALYAAESGANRALWEVAYGGDTWSGWSSLPEAGKQYVGQVRDADGASLGAFVVQITDPGQAESTITATGSRPTGYDASVIQRQVSVQVARGGGEGGRGWFQWGIYAAEKVTVEALAMIDSYDSSEGDWWHTRGQEAQVAVNSTAPAAIDVGWWATIKGDAYIGPEGDPETGITGDVTGTRNAMATGGEPPSVPTPTDITHDVGDVALEDDASMTLSQDTVCDSVFMKDDAQLTINGDVRLYVRGDFEARNNVRIKIPPGSSLEMYVGGRFLMKNAAIVNWQTRIPEQCVIYGLPTCTEVTVMNLALVYAAVYAPQADFQVKNLAAFYGAMTARKATIRMGAAFHYDKNVGDLAPETLPTGAPLPGGGGGDGPWSILSWRITR